MGSVCGSTLALMDAGVPILAPVCGIAMGLVKEGDDYVILTDIQGAEDHLGDMDFKVAGTREGITALQMDIKITGVTQEIMRSALEQAKRARELILDSMADAIPEARTELADNAPRISTIQIDPEQIGIVIGKGGETIRSLEADYDVQIDIEEDGTILIYATEGTKGEAAIAAIEALTKEPEVGDEYTGKVVKTTDFGAFVELKKGTDGLLHVSNVGPGRVAHIEDVHRARRRARRQGAGGRQGARPDRPEARRQARERRARPARGADRAGEGRTAAAPRARSARARRRSRPRRPALKREPGRAARAALSAFRDNLGPVKPYDAIVVGAGPGGSTTAYRLASAGAAVLLLDRAEFPRDKPCGGGLTLRAAAQIPVSIEPVVEQVVTIAELGLAYKRRWSAGRRAARLMTQRKRLDNHLAESAVAAGAEFRDGVKVTAVETDEQRRDGHRRRRAAARRRRSSAPTASTASRRARSAWAATAPSRSRSRRTSRTRRSTPSAGAAGS